MTAKRPGKRPRTGRGGDSSGGRHGTPPGRLPARLADRPALLALLQRLGGRLRDERSGRRDALQETKGGPGRETSPRARHPDRPVIHEATRRSAPARAPARTAAPAEEVRRIAPPSAERAGGPRPE